MVHSQSNIGSFSGPNPRVLTVFDYNGDGLTDILAAGTPGSLSSPGDAISLVLYKNNGGGSFTDVSESVFPSSATFKNPYVLISDYNGNGITDIAVFDAGTYGQVPAGGLGGTPVLLLGQSGFTYTASTTFSDQVESIGYQSFETVFAKDLHVKSLAQGDIDSDGDMDIWVQSAGGDNLTSHFMINDGAGNFTIDQSRISYAAQHGSGSEFWRHQSHVLIDLNNDNHLDVVFGQSRDDDVTHVTGDSFILFNDGTGNFADITKVSLVQPDFYNGYTNVQSVASFDINGDTYNDLVLVHTRNDGVTGQASGEGFTGRYIQILINNTDNTFTDETTARIGVQTDEQSTTNSTLGGSNTNTSAFITATDFNFDGFTDLVLNDMLGQMSTQNPFVYLSNGNGTFSALPTTSIVGTNQYVGASYAIDHNNDGVMDFVEADPSAGADGINSTIDDVASLIMWSGTSNYNNGATSIITGNESDNSTLTSTTHNDIINGAGGTDTAVYYGAKSGYTISESGLYVQVVDGTSNRDGTDQLFDVEKLTFSDGTFQLSDIFAPTETTNGVYRFYNVSNGSHFYSASSTERNTIINTLDQFNYEGPSYKSADSADGFTSAVYRFFNTSTGTHFFTQSEAEKASVEENLPHYTYEGEAYQGYTEQVTGSTALYRFYNTSSDTHFYTANESEKDSIITNLPNYSYEGIAYYVDPII